MVRSLSQLISLLVFLAVPVRAADSIQVELVVPPAETHVLGDPIELIWRFKNGSEEPLAFMWEGCCRLNGRLKVTRLGEELIPIPPGTSTSHQFAKAIRVDPGKSQEFPTFLQDWISIRETGEYQLAGHYRGVLPEQRPQVPRGVNLWRDETEAAPIQIKLVSAGDYLKQRAERAARRGLTLALAGPATVSPMRTNSLSLKISNTSGQAQPLNWPGDFQLWILDLEGNRLAHTAAGIDAPGEAMTVPAKGTVTREVAFSASLFEGEPFGEYDVFVDLAARELLPRVPSGDISVHWRLGARQVAELVSAAAQGPRTGLRNAPLKWLRTYLTEIRPALEDLTPADPAEAALARDLAVAALLKPYSPNPGPANIAIVVTSTGTWRFADALLTEVLGKQTGIDRLASAVGVRRHLGWDLSVSIRPEEAARLEQIIDVVRELQSVQADLASPLRALVPVANSTVAASLTFQTNAVPANFLVRVSKAGEATRVEVARKLPDPQQPQLTALLTPTEIWAAPFNTVAGDQALAELLADPQLKSLQILIMVSPVVTWRELLDTIEPVLRRGVPLDLSLTK